MTFHHVSESMLISISLLTSIEEQYDFAVQSLTSQKSIFNIFLSENKKNKCFSDYDTDKVFYLFLMTDKTNTQQLGETNNVPWKTFL